MWSHPGLRTFIIIWSGQLASSLGTRMTRFALLIWAYEQTGLATTLALLGFYSFGLYIIISPFAGVVIDRLDRRLVMIGADFGAGIMTGLILILYMTDALQIWHLYAIQAVSGAFDAFQMPAFSAATTQLVPKTQYARTSGMRSLSSSTSEVLAPMTAGFLLTIVGIKTILFIDLATFLIAVLMLMVVRIPRPVRHETSTKCGAIFQEIGEGFRFIFDRRGLCGLLTIYIGINLMAALTYYGVLPAMILARSGGDAVALASVQTALGVGGVAGGLIMSIWGGPKRHIHGILAGAGVSFLLGDLGFAIGQSTTIWIAAAFYAAFFIPFISGGNRAIWQAKVTPHLQGRVFSVQGMLQQATLPIGYLAAGPLADQLFEPAMATGAPLVMTFGWLVGSGPGAGMALMFVCTAVLGAAVSLSGYLFRSIRQVEEDLPDHDA